MRQICESLLSSGGCRPRLVKHSTHLSRMNCCVVGMRLHSRARIGATGRGAFMAALAGLHGGGGDDCVRARRIAEREAYVRELDAQVRLPSD